MSDRKCEDPLVRKVGDTFRSRLARLQFNADAEGILRGIAKIGHLCQTGE